jgi:hypothetical protein
VGTVIEFKIIDPVFITIEGQAMAGWLKARGLYGLKHDFRGQLVKEIIHL